MMKRRFFLLVMAAIMLCPSLVISQTFTLRTMNNPDPNLNGLNCVWGSGDTVFAGGLNGTFLKYDGSAWAKITIPVSGCVISIYGSSSSDVWLAVSSGNLLHYDGASVTEAGNLSIALWKMVGFAADDVYLCGNSGALFHYDGSVWASVSNPYSGVNFRGMYGTSANDLYLTGNDFESPYTKRLIHYDGSGFTEIINGDYGSSWRNVWSPDQNSFYIDGGPLYRFEKSSGTVDEISDGFNVVYGFGANNIINAKNKGTEDSLMTYDGVSWKSFRTGLNVHAICSPDNNPNNIFLVGGNGNILHLDLGVDVGIEKGAGAQAGFNIYPNPASGQFVVDLSSVPETGTGIWIFDLAGQQVQASVGTLGGESRIAVDISGLAPGVYFVKAATGTGDSFSRKLLVVK